MKKQIVSIVIPVYNGEKYIEECINSLQQQTYENIEIIVVDDGSKDATKAIVKNISKVDKRVVYIGQENAGVSAARNNGILKSSGQYITFVDADDSVQKDYIEYLYQIMVNNDSEISLTRYPLKFNSKTSINIDEQKQDEVKVYSGDEAANEMLLYKIVISSWNKMFKKDLLMDNNVFFNKTLSFGEGFEFVIKAFLKAKKVAIGNKKIYNYRVDNENSVMTRFSRKLVTGSIDSQKSILSIINASDFDLKVKKQLTKSWTYSNWHTSCDCLNTIVGSNSKNNNIDLYKITKINCRKYALSSILCKIPIKDKIKCILYFISPYIASKVINKFRIRKYTQNN